MPNIETIKSYVSNAVVKSILKFWISNLKLNHLENDEAFKSLKKFMRMALEIHLKHLFNSDNKTRYRVDVLEKIKSNLLKNVTKDITIPSFSGINLADNVKIL